MVTRTLLNDSEALLRLPLLLGLTLALLLFPALAPAQTTPEIPADTEADTNPLPSHIAIRVESETVPMETFRNRVEGLLKQYEKKAKKADKDYDREDIRERISDRIKRKMISRLLLEVHSRRENVEVPAKKIEQAWDRVLKEAGGREKYRKQMKQRGLSLEEAKEQVRVRLRRRQYISNQISNVTVTDTEIKKVYMNHRERFKRWGRKRAAQFIRKKIIEKKENQASRVFIGRLKKKSLVQTNV